MNIALLLVASLIFGFSDLGKKFFFGKTGFSVQTFLDWRFLLVAGIAVFGYALQLYVLSRFDLSRTIILVGVFTTIIAAGNGALFLGEKFNVWNSAGILAAVAAIVLLNIKLK